MQTIGGDHPFRPLAKGWCGKIKLAWDHKKRVFQDDADEAMRFFNGPYDWMYDVRTGSMRSGAFMLSGDAADLPKPSFMMTVNKVAELVQLFGPALYHRNPVRKVTPRKPWSPPIELFGDPNDPAVQAYYQQQAMQVQTLGHADASRAALYEQYLNYTPAALNLKDEARKAIDEAIIKGAGVLWTETYKPRGGQTTLAGSFFDTIDNLVIDPDAETLGEAKWIARRCTHPYWEVEREYGLPPDSLRGRATLESTNAAGEQSADEAADYNRRRGMSNDLLVYWKVWSKMGVGGRLSGAHEGLRERAELLGDYVYLVVADGVGYPLNLPPDISEAFLSDDPAMAEQAVPMAQEAMSWPTPFWADDAWPFTMLSFHWVPRQVWPMSHVKPGMGELKAINWIYSLMVSKLRVSHRDFIAIAKSTSESLKSSIKDGPDYTIIEIEALHESIDKVVKFLQHPEFNPAIFQVVEQIAENFNKRTGLTELIYGMTGTQMRSAAESTSKENFATIRPDDMANKVEDGMSAAARLEAFLARWHLTAEDVAPVLGPVGAQWWQMLVLDESPAAILHGLEFRVEAGSAKKPNKARDAANMQQAMTTLFPPLLQLATMAGISAPVNALLLAWAKSIDLDAEKFLLPTMPPPAPAAPAEPPGPPLPTPAPL